jgi:hypothetical protein
MQVDDAHVDPNRWSHGLNDGKLPDSARGVGIAKDCDAGRVPRQCILKSQKSSCITARLRETFDEARANRIGDVVEDDWHSARRS